MLDRLIVGETMDSTALGRYGTVMSIVLSAEILPSAFASRYILETLQSSNLRTTFIVSVGILGLGFALGAFFYFYGGALV